MSYYVWYVTSRLAVRTSTHLFVLQSIPLVGLLGGAFVGRLEVGIVVVGTSLLQLLLQLLLGFFLAASLFLLVFFMALVGLVFLSMADGLFLCGTVRH